MLSGFERVSIMVSMGILQGFQRKSVDSKKSLYGEFGQEFFTASKGGSISNSIGILTGTL